MLTTLKNWFENAKNAILAVLALVLGVVFFFMKREQSAKEEAQATVRVSEFHKNDAIAQEKLAEVERRRAETIAQAEAEKGRALTHEEMAKFLGDL